MRKAMFCAVLLAAVAAGCSTAPDSASSGAAAEIVGTLDADMQQRYRDARAAQEQALESTRDLLAAPDGAPPEQLEAALNTLNVALLRGRQEVVAVRAAEEVEGRRALIKELREANSRLLQAYTTLVAHHPNPTPEMLDLGADEGS